MTQTSQQDDVDLHKTTFIKAVPADIAESLHKRQKATTVVVAQEQPTQVDTSVIAV